MFVLSIFVCSVRVREGVLNVEETMPVLGEEWDETARNLICTPIRVCRTNYAQNICPQMLDIHFLPILKSDARIYR